MYVYIYIHPLCSSLPPLICPLLYSPVWFCTSMQVRQHRLSQQQHAPHCATCRQKQCQELAVQRCTSCRAWLTLGMPVTSMAVVCPTGQSLLTTVCCSVRFSSKHVSRGIITTSSSNVLVMHACSRHCRMQDRCCCCCQMTLSCVSRYVDTSTARCQTLRWHLIHCNSPLLPTAALLPHWLFEFNHIRHV
jgi:hypothetical protein